MKYILPNYFFKIYFNYVYIYVTGWAHECRYPKSPEVGIGSLEAGLQVTVNYLEGGREAKLSESSARVRQCYLL